MFQLILPPPLAYKDTIYWNKMWLWNHFDNTRMSNEWQEWEYLQGTWCNDLNSTPSRESRSECGHRTRVLIPAHSQEYFPHNVRFKRNVSLRVPPIKDKVRRCPIYRVDLLIVTHDVFHSKFIPLTAWVFSQTTPYLDLKKKITR